MQERAAVWWSGGNGTLRLITPIGLNARHSAPFVSPDASALPTEAAPTSCSPCRLCDEFLPSLIAIARAVPEVPIAQFNGAKEGSRLAENFEINYGTGKLRALFRDAPPDRRLLEYRGEQLQSAIEAWCKGVAEWPTTESLPDGWWSSGSLIAIRGRDNVITSWVSRYSVGADGDIWLPDGWQD